MINKYEKIVDLLNKAHNITILSGAGVSVPSGIPDFRSRGGLYDNVEDVELILSRRFFNKDKELFWKRYKEIFFEKLVNKNFEPNAAHILPHFLSSLGKNVNVITQNVDGLYQKAGNKANIIEMHGTIKTLTCIVCGRKHLIENKINELIPSCKIKTYGDEICNGNLDVDVVLFDDTVKHYQTAIEIVENSDVIIVMGTSMNVYPFATLLTNNKKRKNILLNLTNIDKRPFEVKLLKDVEETSIKIIQLLKELN